MANRVVNMKLYFYYGVMGSSKTANALMTKFNMEEHDKKVLLLKPSLDNRDGVKLVKSRVGISAEAVLVKEDDSVKKIVIESGSFDIIIVDEAQFFKKEQIDDLRNIVDRGLASVMCYGLKTDYMGNLFEGSKRLFEIADSIREIKSLCPCGRKAIMNARYSDGKIVYSGDRIDIGGDDKYKALCYRCWKEGNLH